MRTNEIDSIIPNEFAGAAEAAIPLGNGEAQVPEYIPTEALIREDIFSRAYEAKQQTQRIDAEATVNRETIKGRVVLWEFDLRTEEEKESDRKNGEKEPVIIFWNGFGQQTTSGELTNFEWRLIERGINKRIPKFMFLSISDIPHVTTGSKESDFSNAQLGAELMFKTIRERLGWSDEDGFDPIELYAYSMGSATTVSMAAKVSEYEEEHANGPKIRGKHKIHSLSLTGIADFAEGKDHARVGRNKSLCRGSGSNCKSGNTNKAR